MTGSLNTTLVSEEIALAHNDPLNPFKHKYHPDHDNLDYDFETELSEGKESYEVERTVELQFTDHDPDGFNLKGWGVNQNGGIYRETITGIHKQELHVSGTFRLHHVSRVDVLNDGL